jgi:hypothetical protein
MILPILFFLIGAWVAKMYYSPMIRSANAERDAWEKKAKQAQSNMYSDLIKNASTQIDNNEI